MMKTAILAALDTIEPAAATGAGDRRHALLLLLYAFTAEAAKNSMLDTKDKSDTQVAAEARVFASIMEATSIIQGQQLSILGGIPRGSQVRHVSELPAK